MRPLGIHLIGISIYLAYGLFPDGFGRFRCFFLNANGRIYGPTDGRTYGRTDPHIEMRGRI